MERRGNPIPLEVQGMNDYDRDLEIATLRRTVEQLQRQLEQKQNDSQLRRNRREERGEVEDQNPFGVDNGSSDEDHDYRRQRRQPRRHKGDIKVELLEFDVKIPGDLIGYTLLNEFF